MMPKLSIVLGITAFMWGGFSYYHFWIQYPDLSQLIIYLFIALIILSGAFVWSWKRDVEQDFRDLEEGFGILNKYMETELGNIK